MTTKFSLFDGTIFHVKADLETFAKSLEAAWSEGRTLDVVNDKGARRFVNPYAIACMWEENE